MTKAELQAFAQAQVDLLKPKAADTQKASGQRAKGKLMFYEALLAVYGNTQTPEQFGLLDAVNDTFQEIGAFASGVTFFSKPEECCRTP
ncbi:hypothetical protein SAMN03159376_00788 [Pseudomonas sp. NFACC09-4]|jgi:FPC/CPF motif-containing protein YcgG|uniref:hypothetical protein n=1 Tax=unclassified Pseudomonas TaxID=196821 RepID=UPI000908CDAF|nr:MULTISPECIES: hypothetical protein [unclassified Pseudomonas]ROO35803.1 hypothetical protein BIV09_18350 [Pseudomonas sp. 7SR1]SFW27910.1 hypothetical protein SAMN03159376_00788 [Pseudomonas sp. NFACC09-4]SFX03124.1 hypothetical protein SAMN03159390_00223 [Pseudomonas sp. NFACC49-2]SIS27124.1 hypothetical protein SAMN05428955_5081 [Pseudomonas sp. 7SR1]